MTGKEFIELIEKHNLQHMDIAFYDGCLELDVKFDRVDLQYDKVVIRENLEG